MPWLYGGLREVDGCLGPAHVGRHESLIGALPGNVSRETEGLHGARS